MQEKEDKCGVERNRPDGIYILSAVWCSAVLCSLGKCTAAWFIVVQMLPDGIYLLSAVWFSELQGLQMCLDVNTLHYTALLCWCVAVQKCAFQEVQCGVGEVNVCSIAV